VLQRGGNILSTFRHFRVLKLLTKLRTKLFYGCFVPAQVGFNKKLSDTKFFLKPYEQKLAFRGQLWPAVGVYDAKTTH